MCETMPLMPIHIEANKVPGIGFTYGGMSVPGTYSNQPMSACEQAANEYFQYGLYWNKLPFTISEDDPGHVAIGIDKQYSEERLGGGSIMAPMLRILMQSTASFPTRSTRALRPARASTTCLASV